MEDEPAHEIVGTVISADPWYRPKTVLVRRRTREEGERYWPDRWCYLTEHKEQGESDEATIVRCLREELDLGPPRVILRGPVDVESRDPDHNELFRIHMYEVMVTGLADRMEINPRLNREEASRWIWASPLPAFGCALGFNYATLGNDIAVMRGGTIFEDLHDHLECLYKNYHSHYSTLR